MATGSKQEERRIILLGKVGVGKSALANAILGSKSFESRQSFCSVTHECSHSETTRNGKRFIICDTPGAKGLLNDDKKVQDVLKRCVYVTSPGYHVIVFVISAGQRIEESDVKMFKNFEKLLGDKAYSYCMLAFTHVEPDICKKLIDESAEIKDLCAKCGNRYLCFGAKAEIAKDYVNKFEEEVEKLVSKNTSVPHYKHKVYEQAYEIIMEDAKDIMRRNENLSEEESITEAKNEAFQGRSPRDTTLISLMSKQNCCLIL